MVSAKHDGFFVFNDKQRVAFVTQTFHDADKATDIPRMQADARFIEHEQRIHQGSTETGRQIHALQFATAQGACLTVQIEIT